MKGRLFLNARLFVVSWLKDILEIINANAIQLKIFVDLFKWYIKVEIKESMFKIFFDRFFVKYQVQLNIKYTINELKERWN